MSDAFRRIADALAGASEDEAAAMLNALGGAEGRRQESVGDAPRTPLPPPGGLSTVHSEVEWV